MIDYDRLDFRDWRVRRALRDVALVHLAVGALAYVAAAVLLW